MFFMELSGIEIANNGYGNGVSMDRNLVLTARVVVGLTWLYEGLWLKILRPDALQLHIMALVFQRTHLAPIDLLRGIGGVETMLAFGVLAGWNPRILAVVQILLLVSIDTAGIALGSNLLHDPIGTVLRDLSLLVCILLLGLYDNAPRQVAPSPAPAKSKRPRG